jgi:hypothetical protein
MIARTFFLGAAAGLLAALVSNAVSKSRSGQHLPIKDNPKMTIAYRTAPSAAWA